eukprot:Hpha_TRINITY_DN9342_c0_g2::TRINITY_DN9342_c0_g2_i1::g.25965::m.25965
MYPLPRPILLHRDLKQHFGEVNHAVYAARVINQVTSKGRHQRRIIVVTQDHIFLCETNGTVRRVFTVANVQEAMVAHRQVLINMKSREDPSLLYVETEDPRNVDSPTALEAVRTLWAHKFHLHMPVRACPDDQPLTSFARFQKGEDYQSPRRQLLNIAAQAFTENDVISPSPTDSDVSLHADSPRRQPRLPSAFPLPGPAPGNNSGLDKQLDELRKRMQRQEQELENLRDQNRRLETAAASQHVSGGSRLREYDEAGPPPPPASGDVGRSAIEREIEELQRRHVLAEEGEHARRHAAQSDVLLQSPARGGRESPRYVVLRADQVPPAALASARTGQQSPRFVAMPSPRRDGRGRGSQLDGDAFVELQTAQDRNRQLEARNRLLEHQLRAATEATDKLRSKDRGLRREQRRQERRRRETEAATHMEETKMQIRQVMARVEDFEKRNWEMAQAIQRVTTPGSPEPVYPLRLRDGVGAGPSELVNQWACVSGALPADGQLRTPQPQRVAAPAPELHTYLDTLRDLQRRGAPGLDAAISQLQYQIGA